MPNLDPIDWKLYAPAPIIGVDEVGRGCLAGPVYAGAAILKDDALSHLLTDSKLLSEKRREELSSQIKLNHFCAIGIAAPEEIDELNILQASLLAMRRAVENLWQVYIESTEVRTQFGQLTMSDLQKGSRAHLMIDGTFKIPQFKVQQSTFIKGDLRVAPISAAAIVAKVARDHLMAEMGKEYPQYGFEKHKGYSTAYHKQSIAKHGPCPQHRKSFAGVKEHVGITAR